jgi:hypothetical protein
LAGTTGLALGILRLEGTDNAVTTAQAAQLLPLWQIIESGSLQGTAETEAVIVQIEGTLTESQLAAIEAMGLTFEDMGAWMQEQGIEIPERPSPDGQSAPGAFQNLSEDERAQMREEFQNMSPEQRATRMAEMGVQRPQGEGQNTGFGSGQRRSALGENVLLEPLIALLKERAGQ